MSAQSGLKIDDPNGDGALYVMPYTEDLAQQSALKGVSARTDPEPDSTTPDPVSDDKEDGGIVKRANEFMSSLGPTALEAVGLHGMELSKANAKRAGELYRNKFPILSPKFARQCEDCGAEYDEDVDVCSFCDSTDLREPSPKQRTRAKQFFEEVNREGQSLRQLYKFLARDAGRLGIWVHIVKKNYSYWDRPSVEVSGETVVEYGEVHEHPVELVRGDPKRIKPVVDENGRIGNWWWACPVCADRTKTMQRESGRCEEHGCELREVHYAEVERVSDDDPEKVYFSDEVIDYAAFEPRLGGKDAVSPLDSLWVKQAILHWMDMYAAGFYDQENTNRYPGRMVILHTSNKDAVEKQLSKAQDEADQDAYAQGFLYNEVPPGTDSTTDTAQVLDLMNDEILGQSDQLKQDYKSDIRSRYGLVDAQDSELEDAGGLNNEGLQLTINDRDKATVHQDLMEGPLRKLMSSLGFDDWQIMFVPPEGPEENPDPTEVVQAAAEAEQAGVNYAIEDGRFRVADTDGVVKPEATEPAPEDQPDRFSETDDTPDFDIGLAHESTQAALESLDPDDAVTGSRWIGKAYDSMFDDGSAAVEQQARTPVFRDQGDVPEFAQELLGDAIEGGAVAQPDALSNAEHRRFESILERNLVEEGRWSISSIQSDIESAFDVDSETARVWAINGVQNVVQPAIQLGYMVEGDLDDRRFYLGGPENADTCEACEQLRDETNPHTGGDPVTMDEFNDRAREVAEGHGIDSEFVTGGALHPNCVHRLSEHRDARDDS